MNYSSTLQTPVGLITIFADDEQVTEITFSEKDTAALEGNYLTQQAAQQLDEYFKGNLQTFSFPFKQQGTDFQQEVWQSLMNINYADTLSYAKFSEHKPLAIRAIAAANGKNKLAVVVPCHRVIGSD
ncbi:MAG: methylated-DNA--[protein]-cysteine S-methyltransferase, partial [Pedobacter sp.]